MNHRFTALPPLFAAAALLCAATLAGCSKKEPAPPAANTPATPAAAAPQAAEPTPPAAATAATPTQAPAPVTPAATPAPAATAPQAQTPALPGGMANSLTALQNEAQKTSEGGMAGIAASAGALQKEAEELLARYSGELATIKSGALAVKQYVEKHPEILPEAAKAKYQQLTAMVPQLESLVATLKDYKKADLTTLVPKLQKDFAQAKSLYSEVRALLPEKL